MSLARDVFKVDVALHALGGAILGAWLDPPTLLGDAGLVIVLYLAGEARELLELVGNFTLTICANRDAGAGPTWQTLGESFGRKRRIEALAWPVGAVLGIAVAALVRGIA